MLEVIADVADVKVPHTVGHSRGRGSARRADAGAELGLEPRAIDELRRAALVHDLGPVGIPRRIWDGRAALREQWEQVRLHPYLTERVLRPVPALARVARIAGATHESCDGSGYHRGLGGALLSAARGSWRWPTRYVAMTEARP